MTTKFSPEQIVNVTELRTSFAKYLKMSQENPVAIQKNGVIVAIMIGLKTYAELKTNSK